MAQTMTRKRETAKPKTAKSKGAKHKAVPAAPPSGEVLAKVTSFDIEAEKLPKAVSDGAMRSGQFPYDDKYDEDSYEAEIEALQIELLKLQSDIKESGKRVIVVFEGRDGAGKGGAIQRFTEHLNPRNCRVVALSKPSEAETGQWYFQRYAAHFPTAGEMVLFDRSWYNRAGVERVFGFAKPEQVERFLADVPVFEKLLSDEGITLIKLFLTIGREMQMKRLHKRWHDPLKRWKLSPLDFEAIDRWDQYSDAFDENLSRTDHAAAPWTIIRANDKLRTRLETVRVVLNAFEYKGKDAAKVGVCDPKIVLPAAEFLKAGGEPEVTEN
jgi:polyphosphate kinase